MSVATHLTNNVEKSPTFLSRRHAVAGEVEPHVQVVPELGCWLIRWLDSMRPVEWSEATWGYHRAIAEALVAMPFAPEESNPTMKAPHG